VVNTLTRSGGPKTPNVLKVHDRGERALSFVCGALRFDFEEDLGLFRESGGPAVIRLNGPDGWAIDGVPVAQAHGWPYIDWAVAHVYNCRAGEVTK
jgi:hypothetical protein